MLRAPLLPRFGALTVFIEMNAIARNVINSSGARCGGASIAIKP
jgi:hypothetical protein